MVSFDLRRSIHSADAQLLLKTRGAIGLLDCMCQFVRQQVPSRVRRRSIVACSKDDVSSDRVRQRIDSASGFGRRTMGMHPNMAEVVTEARFHEGARFHVKRLSWRA
jgi:hypothetical protein